MSTTTTQITAVSGSVRGPVGDWRHRAACRGVDPELFYPVAEDGPPYEEQVAAAKAVCAGCPVRAECLAFALVALPHGIAGGMTPAERRRHRMSGPRRVSSGEGCPAGGSRPEIAAAGRRTAEGSHGGNPAPHLISHAHNPQAGTRAAEGHRG
jgi:hypothetical protein